MAIDGMPEGPVQLTDVRDRINLAEQFLGELSPGDDYMEAILQNQVTLNQLLVQQGRLGGGIVDDYGGPGGVFSDPEASALPVDATGTVARDINPHDTGPAIFQLQGSIFYTIVTNDDNFEMQAGTSVRVIGDENTVTARGAAASIAGAGGGGQISGSAFRYQGRLYQIPNVADQEENVKVANQKYIRGQREDTGSTLEPGQDKEVARIEPDANEFLLLKYTNATAHDTVRYDYYVDDPEEPDPDLSGSVPWATPPDLHEASPDGYQLVEDYVSLHMVETSGSTEYNTTQGTLTGLIIEAQS